MAEAAEAKTGDFTHDAIGIYVNLDRKTGTLKNFFVPRYAQTERKGPDMEALTQSARRGVAKYGTPEWAKK